MLNRNSMPKIYFLGLITLAPGRKTEKGFTMDISYQPENTFLSRIVHFKDPEINGWYGIGIYGLNLERLNHDLGVRGFQLQISNKGIFSEGKLLNIGTIDLNGQPMAQIRIGEKQVFLQNWLNMRNLFLDESTRQGNRINCSGFFVFKQRKKYIIESDFIALSVTDSESEVTLLQLEITDKMRSNFSIDCEVMI